MVVLRASAMPAAMAEGSLASLLRPSSANTLTSPLTVPSSPSMGAMVMTTSSAARPVWSFTTSSRAVTSTAAAASSRVRWAGERASRPMRPSGVSLSSSRSRRSAAAP